VAMADCTASLISFHIFGGKSDCMGPSIARA
jgi:hypothetical protein